MPELPSFLTQHWAELISLAIFLYAFIVLLTTTTLLTTGIVRTCFRLRNARTRDQLLGAFARSRLEHLLDRILDLAPSDVSGDRVVIQSPFRADRARREVAHLYRGRLARVHFFSAFIALLVIAALSWIQDYAAITNSRTTLQSFVPTVAAALALALFGVLDYLVINAVAKLLLYRISELPAQRVEVTWLRMLTTFVERVGSGAVPALENDSVARIEQLLDQLNEATNRNSRSLHDSVLRLSPTAEAFTETVRGLESPALSVQASSFEKVGELNAVIGRLTTELDRLTTALRSSPVLPHPNGVDTDSQVSARPNGGVKQQLRDLLREFE
jgi:hypothetical protein